MKVLVVTNMYPYKESPFYGMVVKEHVDFLRKKAFVPEVFFINGKKSRFNYLKGMIALFKLLASKNYDIIHAHHTYCGWMAYICMRYLKKSTPLVLTHHEGEVFCNGKAGYKIDPIEKLKYLNSFKDFVIRKMDHLILVSEELREYFPGSNYSVLPCGVDVDAFKLLSQKECRKKLAIAEDKKVIFFPSDYLRPEKRFDLVQEAFQRLKGYFKGKLMLIEGGDINYEMMPFYFNASDVVVLASDYEASPMVVKEALSCGVPIVSTDVGDVKRLVKGVKAFHIARNTPEDIAGKIKMCLDFHGKTNGRERLLELGLSQEQINSEIVKIYEKLISSG